MANDFTGYSDAVALYRLESGALTVDSLGGNTLTDNNTVGEDTVDFKEGSGCADIERSASESLSCDDVNLDADFPFKSGGSETNITVCSWFKPEAVSQLEYIITKYETTGNKRCIGLFKDTSGRLYLNIGYNSGASFESSTTFTALTSNIWYHIGWSINGTTGAYRIRVWDDNAGALLAADVTGTFSNSIYTSDAAFRLGYPTNGGDGKYDEVFVSKGILTTTQIDQIRAGTFGSGGNIITKGVFAFSGKALYANETYPIGADNLTFSGKAVNASSIFSLTNGIFSFSGQSLFTNKTETINKLTTSLNGKALFTAETHTFQKGNLSFVGKTLATVTGVFVSIDKAILSFTGNNLFLNEVYIIPKTAFTFAGKSVIVLIDGIVEAVAKGLNRLGFSNRMN